MNSFFNPINFKHGDIDPDDPGKPVKNPVGYTKTSIAKGKKLFIQYCVECHGRDGIGNGPEAAEIEPKPANLRKVKSPTDTYLYRKISIGNDEMPTWKIELKEKQIWHLTNYIKRLNKVKIKGKNKK
jgi:putative copper resistance protein D